MKKSTLLSGTVALLAVAPLHLALAGGGQVAAPQPSEIPPTTPSQVKAPPTQTPGAEQQSAYGAAPGAAPYAAPNYGAYRRAGDPRIPAAGQGYSAPIGGPGAYAAPTAPYATPYDAPGYGR